jgi:hypothetical protein
MPHPSFWGETDAAPICGRHSPCAPAWAGRAPMPAQVYMHAATSDGTRLYAAGGRDANQTPVNTVFAYDPATDSWQTRSPMPAPRYHTSAVTRDPSSGGVIYVINGNDGSGPTNTVFSYYPASNTWVSISPLGGATYAQSAVYSGGRLYRIGGIDAQGTYTTSVVSSSGTPVASLPEGRAGAHTVAIGGYIYLAGGASATGEVTTTYRYDPVANVWSDEAIADMPTVRQGAASGVVDGRWVLAGGHQTESSTIAWDPATNTWSAGPPLPQPRAWLAGDSLGGALFALGGVGDQTVTGTNQRYSPLPCSVTPGPTNTLASTATQTPTVTPTVTGTPPTSTLTPTTCALTFADVPPTNTFYPFVRCLACRGIVSGYPCGGTVEPCDPNQNPYFRPNNPVTRGQLAKIVSESAGFDEEVPPSQWTFTDVPYGSTFWLWVERLASREVMAGYPCGANPNEPCDDQNRPYFRPGNGATRGQLTKIVVNAAGFVNGPPPNHCTFADTCASTFFHVIELLVFNRPGVMAGYPCGSPGEPCDSQNRPYFRPNNGVTRGQTSKIVANTFFPGCSPPLR